MVVEEKMEAVRIAGDLRDGEALRMQPMGAHPRRSSDGALPSHRRLFWPNGGCSELWRPWLILGSIASVNSSRTSRPMCQGGGPANPEARRSSVTPFQVVSSPATELLAVTGEEDASTVVKDLMAFPNATLGSFLQKGEALFVIFFF
jgi:hypothetical protein